jgi:hypothetical protein
LAPERCTPLKIALATQALLNKASFMYAGQGHRRDHGQQ